MNRQVSNTDKAALPIRVKFFSLSRSQYVEQFQQMGCIVIPRRTEVSFFLLLWPYPSSASNDSVISTRFTGKLKCTSYAYTSMHAYTRDSFLIISIDLSFWLMKHDISGLVCAVSLNLRTCVAEDVWELVRPDLIRSHARSPPRNVVRVCWVNSQLYFELWSQHSGWRFIPVWNQTSLEISSTFVIPKLSRLPPTSHGQK